MERLWAPWRMDYIIGPKAPAGTCVFCDAAEGGDDAQTHVLQRGAHCFSILNRYPYNNGHLMVVPYVHVSALGEVTDAALAEMMQTAARWTEVLRQQSAIDGCNLGMNLGAAAGAGIRDHLHLHLVPRWHGDTNFISVIGEARVLPEELPVTWERLRAGWCELVGGA